MKRLFQSFLVLLWLICHGTATPLNFADAIETLSLDLHGNGRDQLALVATNPTNVEIKLHIPAGLVCSDDAGKQKVLVPLATILTIPPNGIIEAVVPTVALSSRNTLLSHRSIPSRDKVERLLPLMAHLAGEPAIPRETTQLVALCLLENISFAQWQKFPDPQPAASDAVVTAIDALGILRRIVPDEKPALEEDSELKIRALRNPVTRLKAMQLYGMNPPAALEGGVAPDLRQLLHAKPGDNCPTCRARARGAASPNDL